MDKYFMMYITGKKRRRTCKALYYIPLYYSKR